MSRIVTNQAPDAIGPYSQGVEMNGIIFTSEQIAIDPLSGTIPEGITAQAEQSCKNVLAVVQAAGGSANSIIKTTCYLADMEDFAAFNEVYARFFLNKPARSCVAVKTLPKNALCEIEAIAQKEG